MSEKPLAEINQEEYKALLKAIQDGEPFDSNRALLCLLLKSELDEAKITKLEERIEALEYSVEKLECNEDVRRRINLLAEKAENLEAEILEACWNNKTDIVIKLIENANKEIDVKEIDENGSLNVAVRNQNATIVEELLKVGCKPNIINSKFEKMMKCPLYSAIEKCNLNILKLLLEHDGDANLKHMYGETPLHYAVRNGDIQIVKELLDNGANSDAQDSYQTTPLIIALESKRIDIAETLLAYGANINYPCNSIGQTVLHDMICNGTIEIIKHGMLVNIKMEIIQFLLENGANVDLASYNKETPLLASLIIDRLDIAECLLKKGANVNTPCLESGQTVLHYVITHCRQEQNLT